MRTRFRLHEPQGLAKRNLSGRPLANPTKARPNFAGRVLTLGIIAACALALSPEPALGQRGGSGSSHTGGGHVGLGGVHSSGGISHSQSATVARPVSAATGARNASANTTPNARTGNATVSSPAIIPPASVHFGSSVVTTPGGDYPVVDKKTRIVTIGFPPRSPNEPRISSPASGSRTTFSGEGDHFWEEQVQRPPTSPVPQHQRVPVATPPTAAAPSRSAPHPPAVTSPASGRETQRTLSIARPTVTSPPHVWPPRKGSPRSPHVGFGFFEFGFGYPFLGFGFVPECVPLWVEPWASGCEPFGYWNGYGVAYNGGVYQAEDAQGIEQSSQEPVSTYDPAPETSPEEIEAEKILVVLFMKNGAVYAVTNYWIADGKLHYLTSYGGENTIEMDDLDLQKTVDVNAKRGVDFTLKPSPDKSQPDQPQPQQQDQSQQKG
jgi:hypothetical protein